MTETAVPFKKYYGSMIKTIWNSSRLFRIILIGTIVWAVLRLVAQLYFAFSGSAGDQIGVDLQVHLNAARHFTEQANLYPQSLQNLENHFPYPPIFAMLIVPLTWPPVNVTIVVYLLLHVVIYYLLFIRWGKIFQRWNMEKAGRMLILSIPAWLLFSAFWDDLTYLNIYILLALLGTLLIEATLNEDLVQSSIWLTLIIVTKPQWAFAAVIPLLLGRYRFFFKMLGLTLACYLFLALATAWIGGPAYVLGQYKAYLDLLNRLGWDFPWRGPASGFMGYNHSIKQIFAFLFGNSTTVLWIATVVKIVLLVPLGIIATQRIFQPLRTGDARIKTVLEIAFLIYLGAFIWLDILWEASLSIALVVYLFSETKSKTTLIVVGGVFFPYAILDVWRLICYIAGSPMINEAYLRWDYSIYIPTTMITILGLYFVFVTRLWPWHRKQLAQS